MRILHIDDRNEITDALNTILQIKKYDYFAVNDAQKGLELLSADTFDLVLLDLTMPKISGFDVLKELDSRKFDMKKIIVMTAASLGDSERKILSNYGIHGIIFKPFKLNIILNEILKIQSGKIATA